MCHAYKQRSGGKVAGSAAIAGITMLQVCSDGVYTVITSFVQQWDGGRMPLLEQHWIAGLNLQAFCTLG